MALEIASESKTLNALQVSLYRLPVCRYREAELAHGRVCMLAVVSSESAQLVKGKPWMMLAVLSMVCSHTRKLF